MTKGAKTTEFWVTLAAMLPNVQPIIEQSANSSWNAAFMAIAAGAYSMARAHAKRGGGAS